MKNLNICMKKIAIKRLDYKQLMMSQSKHAMVEQHTKNMWHIEECTIRQM